MRRAIFYGWIVVAVTALPASVAAGWIAIIAGFAALGISRTSRAAAAGPGDLAAT